MSEKVPIIVVLGIDVDDKPHASRFAERDAERMRQLNELCRPVPGARAERKQRFGCGGKRRFGHGDRRPLHLWLDADVQLEMGQQAIRRGVSTSAIVREAWALAGRRARTEAQSRNP